MTGWESESLACNPGVKEADNSGYLIFEVVCIGHLGVLSIDVAHNCVVVEELLGGLPNFIIPVQLLRRRVALFTTIHLTAKS